MYKKEIELMKLHAYRIWGGIPKDYEWAINTLVWKNYKNKNGLDNE